MITAIEYITRTKAKVYIDEDFAFVLSRTEIEHMGFAVGYTLTGGERAYIYDELLTHKAKKKAMNLLKAKDYTEYELRQKLKRDYFPDVVIDQAIDYVKDYHYIDDRRYTESYLAFKGNHKSRQAVRYELASKGVPDDIIEREMESHPINDIANILILMERRFCPEDLQDDQKKQKIYGYFTRKGFKLSDVKEAMNRFGINDDMPY